MLTPTGIDHKLILVIPYLTMTDRNLTLAVPRISSNPEPGVSSVLVLHQNPAQLPPNHVLVRVDRFGFTANNVTYQALGEEPHFR